MLRCLQDVGNHTRTSSSGWINRTSRGLKRRGRGRPPQIVPSRTPEQKVPDFLEALSAGRSATAAARDLDTTVSTMSKQVLPDSGGSLKPIISKSGRRWVADFLPVHRYSTVVYGKLESMDGNTLGRGLQAGPNASTKRGKDYTDIWWQLDLDPLTSVLVHRCRQAPSRPHHGTHPQDADASQPIIPV